MNRVLLAVDGSEYALEAARSLAFFAQAKEYMVLHVVNVPSMPYYTSSAPVLSSEIDEKLRQDGEALVAHIASILPVEAWRIRTRVLTGAAANGILSMAQDEDADLIVIGARGTGLIEELVLGSVSHRVVTHAHCPTLMVKQSMQSLQRVLVAVEGPDDADAACNFLRAQPFKDRVQVTVFTCPPINRPEWPVEIVSLEPHVQEAIEAAKVFVDSVASRLVGLGYEAGGRVKVGIPALMITQQAAATNADVILMGSHGRRGLSRFLMGSVAHAVLHRSRCPVLVVSLRETVRIPDHTTAQMCPA